MLWTETPKELAAALLLCLVSSVPIPPKEQGLSTVGSPSCLSIPDTFAASFLHAGFSPKHDFVLIAMVLLCFNSL